jgi:replicative DNA helicase
VHTTAERVPPHSLQAEESLLGAALLSRDALEATSAIVTPGDFYKPALGIIWDVLVGLLNTGQSIDPFLVAERLRSAGLLDTIGGQTALVELQSRTPSTTSAPRYAGIVREKADARRAIQAAEAVIAASYADHLDEARRHAETAIDILDQATQPKGPRHLADILLDDWYPAQEERRAGTATVPSGFPDLDRILGGGWRDGQLIVVAARTSMGKTALAGAFACRAAEAGHPVYVGSVEMAGLELADRWVAAEGRISADAIRSGIIPPRDDDRLGETITKLGGWPVYVDDRDDLTVAHVRAGAKAMPERPRLVIVDYVQILTPAERIPGHREAEVARITSDLKKLARRLGVPVIAVAQLNRAAESRSDKRPQLADLRESGAIENDADVVIGLYRDEYYNPSTKDAGVMEAIVMKQRSGPRATARLAWLAQWNAVTSLAAPGLL